MQPKDYQWKTLERLERWIEQLHEQSRDIREDNRQRQKTGRQPIQRNGCEEAWRAMGERRELPPAGSQGGGAYAPWQTLRDGMGWSIPHVCFKVPTGGGKTLLAVHALQRLTTLYWRRRHGFVLWIVPSETIYRQTWRNLKERDHPYRQALEAAGGGRIKLLEKDGNFSLMDSKDSLCVMLLMLQSSSRRSQETLRLFRSRGALDSFFPEVDDYPGQNRLLNGIPNLEHYKSTASRMQGLLDYPRIVLSHSLGNVLRLLQPLMIIDEGHRAYSPLARDALSRLNPSFMLELSATPNMNSHSSNVLVDIGGGDLKREQMIKLPVQLHCGESDDWKATLRKASEKLDELAAVAQPLRGDAGRFIRPIMLVRVERTGQGQRGGGFIHAEDARAWLLKMGAQPHEIKVKSSSMDELGNENLLSESSLVRYVITKDALREGWDCSFAYVLALLNRGDFTRQAMTQMLGRVLRQPQALLTDVAALDRCYVFCCNPEVGAVVEDIKAGLKKEGLGDLSDDVLAVDAGDDPRRAMVVQRSAPFKDQRIMLPRVLHKDAGGVRRKLDYESDILGGLNWDSLHWRGAADFNPSLEPALWYERLVDLGDDATQTTVSQYEPPPALEPSALARRLMDIVPNPWRGAAIVSRALKALKERGWSDEKIAAASGALLENIRCDLKQQVDYAAAKLFKDKLAKGKITFQLVQPDKLNWEVGQTLTIFVNPESFRSKVSFQRSLFERIDTEELNNYERKVAFYLDDQQTVAWWFRLAARGAYGLQGWRRGRIYPDFLIALRPKKGGYDALFLETKGGHLQGNDDTLYKQNLMSSLLSRYAGRLEAGELRVGDGPKALRFKILLDSGDWKNDLQNELSPPPPPAIKLEQ